MIYLFYFVLFINLIFSIIVLSNFFFNNIYLKRLTNSTNSKKNIRNLVSVLIPARNEQKNIGNLLNDLINQNYKNIEIIIFNDCSTDKTKDVVEQFIKIDKRIKLINSNYLPKGWFGKNFACYNLAKVAKGDFFLFLDADVRIKDNLIRDVISFIEDEKISFISIFPIQKMVSLSEKIFIPIIYNILLSLLPLYLVLRSKDFHFSAAIGQFMFFKKETYLKYQPHKLFKESKAEDIEIASFLKNNNEKICCLVGDRRLTCRMYQNYYEVVNGFSRFINYIFFKSYLLAFVFWFIEFISFVFIFYFKSLFLLFLILLKIFFISLTSRQNIILNLVFSPLNNFSLIFIIFRSYIANKSRKIFWKDRIL